VLACLPTYYHRLYLNSVLDEAQRAQQRSVDFFHQLQVLLGRIVQQVVIAWEQHLLEGTLCGALQQCVEQHEHLS
jgi:hypothetical protein